MLINSTNSIQQALQLRIIGLTAARKIIKKVAISLGVEVKIFHFCEKLAAFLGGLDLRGKRNMFGGFVVLAWNHGRKSLRITFCISSG